MDFEGRKAFALVATARKDFGQVLGQSFNGAVVQQNAPEGIEQATQTRASFRQLTKKGSGGLGQKTFGGSGEPFVKGLLGIGQLAGQGDDRGDPFKSQEGL